MATQSVSGRVSATEYPFTISPPSKADDRRTRALCAKSLNRRRRAADAASARARRRAGARSSCRPRTCRSGCARWRGRRGPRSRTSSARRSPRCGRAPTFVGGGDVELRAAEVKVIGTWKATTPGPGEPPASSQLAAPAMPGRGRSSAPARGSGPPRPAGTRRRSDRAASCPSAAGRAPLRSGRTPRCASSGVRPLISTLIGVLGKAFRTSRSVGTRKSEALKPFGGLRLPVAMPRNL